MPRRVLTLVLLLSAGLVPGLVMPSASGSSAPTAVVRPSAAPAQTVVRVRGAASARAGARVRKVRAIVLITPVAANGLLVANAQPVDDAGKKILFGRSLEFSGKVRHRIIPGRNPRRFFLVYVPAW